MFACIWPWERNPGGTKSRTFLGQCPDLEGQHPYEKVHYYLESPYWAGYAVNVVSTVHFAMQIVC